MRKDLNELEIINLYQAGNSLSQIAVKYKSSSLTIRKLLDRNGVEIRPKHFFNRKQKKCHNIILDYFKVIDSQEKAYWLGVLISDGTIQKDGYKTTLASKDKDLIFKFKKSIGSDHPISKINQFDKRTKKTYTRYSIQVNSKEFTYYLINQGVTNKKSYNCLFPKIEKKFYLSFLRGLFDGDGSLTVKNKSNIRMSFTATKEILNSIQLFLKQEFGVEPHPIYRTSEVMNVFRTHYFGDTNKILSLLYKDSVKMSRLDRKYNLYVKNKK